MVDPDTGKPCHVIMKYGKNYDEYWTWEDVAIQIQDTHRIIIELHPGWLPLYVFYNSENHHKIATDDFNARKLNLNNGGENTPLLHDGYYRRPDGIRVVHVMQTEASAQKGIFKILTGWGLWLTGMKKQ